MVFCNKRTAVIGGGADMYTGASANGRGNGILAGG